MLRSPTGMTSVGGWQTIFGQAVRSRRLDLELTLEEASAAAGVSRSHFNLIELGKATGISRDCAVKDRCRPWLRGSATRTRSGECRQEGSCTGRDER
jgi:hypothetical protein